MKATRNSMKASRRLRRQMTPPEALLWKLLQGSPCGIRFRRQYAIGPYVADFYCPSAKTVIELDGQVHNFQPQAEHDLRRDDVIREFGVQVYRVAASDVMKDAKAVASAIVDTCFAGPFHHSATPSGPPPHRLRRQGGSGEAALDNRSCPSRSDGEGDRGAKRHGGGAK